tara:strand:+ start:379 stop:786 length:408 start_codon:yes stop_codon:yes gene_type:complete
MNLDKFYQSFHDQNGDYSDDELKILEIKSTPRYKFGMFVKIVINGKHFNKHLLKFFKGDEGVEVERGGLFLIYARAWYWVMDFDFKDDDWVDSITHYDFDETLLALKLCIKYFEGLEDYEKCTHLFSIEKLLKNT